MQQRVEPRDSLDYFPTPPWATRALAEKLTGLGFDLAMSDAWEPACGELHMVKPMREAFGHVRASDVFDYGDHLLIDFATEGATRGMVDWVWTNPPFRLAATFIDTALRVARQGVAMFARTSFLEGDERFRETFWPNPPAYVFQFVERAVLLKGRLIRAGAVDPFAEVEGRKASSATSYCWVVWIKGEHDTRFRWIEKCRLRLERPGDYPDYSDRFAPAEIADAPLLAAFA